MNNAPGTIVATNLSKVYRIQRDREDERPSAKADARRHDEEERHALRDFALTFLPGRVYGVIGPRASGKTTLLKILAGMLPPSTGSVTGRGRVVGVFDDDWLLDDWHSGVENAYEQGKLFGWSRAEMKAKIAAISEFGDLQEFMHEKISAYSPGMRLRLTMSMAFNLQPQLLVLDDILGVGDDGFREKCIHQIGLAAQRGATIIFATRDMNDVSRLCNKVLWMNAGRLHLYGRPHGVVSQYNSATMRIRDDFGSAAKSAFGAIQAVRVYDGDLNPLVMVSDHTDIVLQIAYKALIPADSVSVRIKAVSGATVAFSAEHAFETRGEKGRMWAAVRIPRGLLARQTYRVDVEVVVARRKKRVKMKVRGAVEFAVLTRNVDENEQRLAYAGAMSRMTFAWRHPGRPAPSETEADLAETVVAPE